MSPRISRRRFLQQASLVAAGVLTGLTACRKRETRPESPEEGLRLVLTKHLYYLTITPGSIERYSADVLARVGHGYRRRLLEILHLGRQYTDRDSNELANPYPWLPRMEKQLVTRFLLSSDFFQRGADERQPVRYLAYYDPYLRPCANPFARFDHDS